MPAALIDETGNTYGSLTVLKPIRTPEMRKTMWLCQCSCGEQKIFNGSELRAGKRTSCGKNCNNIKREKPGTIYGYLKVLEQDKTPAKNFSDKCVHWICECQLCGTIKSISGKNLRNGDTKSCGCLESIGERYIAKALQELNYQYKKEYTFDDLRGEQTNRLYRFDFAVFDNDNLLFVIEFNGSQHFHEDNRSKDSLYKRQERDSLKDEYCSNNKISRLYFNHPFKGRFSGSYEEIKKEIQLFYEEIKEKKGYVKVLNYDF